MLAHTPAARGPARIPILDIFSKTPSPKARLAINNDIVNPIPPSQAAPKIARHDSSAGTAATPDFAAPQANNQIPSGLPTNRPRIIPRLTGCPVAAATLPKIRTPEFENA